MLECKGPVRVQTSCSCLHIRAHKCISNGTMEGYLDANNRVPWVQTRINCFENRLVHWSFSNRACQRLLCFVLYNQLSDGCRTLDVHGFLDYAQKQYSNQTVDSNQRNQQSSPQTQAIPFTQAVQLYYSLPTSYGPVNPVIRLQAGNSLLLDEFLEIIRAERVSMNKAAESIEKHREPSTGSWKCNWYIYMGRMERTRSCLPLLSSICPGPSMLSSGASVAALSAKRFFCLLSECERESAMPCTALVAYFKWFLSLLARSVFEVPPKALQRFGIIPKALHCLAFLYEWQGCQEDMKWLHLFATLLLPTSHYCPINFWWDRCRPTECCIR